MHQKAIQAADFIDIFQIQRALYAPTTECGMEEPCMVSMGHYARIEAA